MQQVLDERGPGAGRMVVTDVVWSSRFRIHHRVADTYRAGRLLIAGDAAHVHSPAGGQGMNLGIQDAVVLADALATVLAGGPDTALDEYSAARRPIATRRRLADRPAHPARDAAACPSPDPQRGDRHGRTGTCGPSGTGDAAERARLPLTWRLRDR